MDCGCKSPAFDSIAAGGTSDDDDDNDKDSDERRGLEITAAATTTAAAIKETKVKKLFPFGRLLAGMYRMYSGISMLDHVQLDRDKLMIKMTNNKHPDKLFERMFAVKKQWLLSSCNG